MMALVAQIENVRLMQAHWPGGIEVVTRLGDVEMLMPAEHWLTLANGQLLHDLLGGTQDFAGIFVCARRVLS